MQKRRPVGLRTVRKHVTEVSAAPGAVHFGAHHEEARSSLVRTAPSSGAKKLGHPLQLSYLVVASNSGCPHAAQANVPSALFVVQRTGARALGAVLPEDSILLR